MNTQLKRTIALSEVEEVIQVSEKKKAQGGMDSVKNSFRL